jgi:hypothetical protein
MACYIPASNKGARCSGAATDEDALMFAPHAGEAFSTRERVGL